ncbi:glycerophosphodiester phosphodiesterase [Desertivirga brevis]|uniref:glycerophosphodiester phosphodiesterase n=1 Tax=Desertivirga brevis TaxID=2810310 RepID=UPI001A957723|nr:glycerophosphodiester phosphodiesterase family protein [Pedobacter sp. SYSU D00873]
MRFYCTKSGLFFIALALAMFNVSTVGNLYAQSVKGLFLSSYKVKPGVPGARVAVVTDATKAKLKVRLDRDTSGSFKIVKGNRLKLKPGRVLPPGAEEFEISVSAGSRKKDFVLVKDEFIRNKVVAHRGAWKDAAVPQNSLKSEELAIKAGCEAAEFDIWLSADGIPVVAHDAIIGGKKIEESTAMELQQVHLGGGEYVPTLEQYLRAIKGQNKTRLFLEIKTSGKGQERCLELAEKAVDMVHALKVQAWVDYISFNYGVLQHIAALDPFAQTAYLWGDRDPATVAKDGLTGLDYPIEHFKKNPSWIADAKKLGLSVNSWTINQEAPMLDLLKWDVDYITTDEPLKLLKLIEDRKNATAAGN